MKVCKSFDAQLLLAYYLKILETNNGIDEKQIDKFNHNSALDCDNSSIMKKLRTYFLKTMLLQ